MNDLLNLFEEIRRRTDIETVFRAFLPSADLKPSARGFKCKCPLPNHQDDTPSFYLYTDTQTFYCFGCGEWGDGVSLVAKCFGLSSVEAAKRINDAFALNLFTTRRGTKYYNDRERTAQKDVARYRRFYAEVFDLVRDVYDETDEHDERHVLAEGMISANMVKDSEEFGVCFDANEPNRSAKNALTAAEMCGVDAGKLDAVCDRYFPRDNGVTLPTPTNAKNVKIVPQKYLWYPYFPAGEVCVVSAAGGTGKSQFLSAVIARLTQGWELPQEKPTPESGRLIPDGEAVKCLYISSEETESQLRTRNEISRAKAENIGYLAKDTPGFYGIDLSTDEGAKALQDRIAEGGYRLTVIDPLSSYIGDSDTSKGTVMRAIINDKLSRVAMKTESCIVAIVHTNKAKQDADINNGLLGSSEIRNAVRSILMINDDISQPEGTEWRIAMHTKTNMSRGKTLRFRIVPFEGGILDGATEKIDDAAGGRFEGAETWFSDITPTILTDANRARRNPREYWTELRHADKLRQEKQTLPADLVNALKAEAEEMRGKNVQTVRYTYDEFTEKHGNVFGMRKPADAIHEAALAAHRYGVTAKGGIQMRNDGDREQGLKISLTNDPV